MKIRVTDMHSVFSTEHLRKNAIISKSYSKNVLTITHNVKRQPVLMSLLHGTSISARMHHNVVDATKCYNAVVMRRRVGLRHGNAQRAHCACHNEHLETRYHYVSTASQV